MNSGRQRVKTITKRDIVRYVAEARKSKIATAAPWVEQVFATVRDVLMTDVPALRIEIRDFGVFEVKPTKSKPKARNPRSGEIIIVPSRRKTHFKPGKLLKKHLSRPLADNGVSDRS